MYFYYLLKAGNGASGVITIFVQSGTATAAHQSGGVQTSPVTWASFLGSLNFLV
jgi:hypothetical protein